MVNAARIVAVISPDSAPSRRLVQNARESGMLIDATQGRRTRAVIITSDDHVVLCAILPDTIASRNNQNAEPGRHAASEDGAADE